MLALASMGGSRCRDATSASWKGLALLPAKPPTTSLGCCRQEPSVCAIELA